MTQPLDTIDRATGRWRWILSRLGVDSRFLVNRHGPCPVCGGKDRFRFDDKDGSGSHFCNQCGSGPGIMLVRKLHGWDHRTACDEIDKLLGGAPTKAPPAARRDPHVDQKPDRTPAEGIAFALELFDRAVPAHPIMLSYLRTRLGGIEPDPAWIGDLRFLRECPFRPDGKVTLILAAMLARIRDIRTGEPCGIQRTALAIDDDGVRRDRSLAKMTLGRAKGGAVMLSSFDEPAMGLGLAEGVETGMSVLAIGWAPVWVTCGTGGMTTFPVLPGIEALTIWADTGEGGQTAAAACAERWSAAGREARIAQPPAAVGDMNDLLRGDQ